MIAVLVGGDHKHEHFKLDRETPPKRIKIQTNGGGGVYGGRSGMVSTYQYNGEEKDGNKVYQSVFKRPGYIDGLVEFED